MWIGIDEYKPGLNYYELAVAIKDIIVSPGKKKFFIERIMVKYKTLREFNFCFARGLSVS